VTRLASVVVAIVIAFISSPVAAQVPATAPSMALTVSAPRAEVRKGPSLGSPVIGQAPRGAVLDVTRDIGAWVKVNWPDASDGVGYVHESAGTLSNRASREQRIAEAVASLPPPEPAAEIPAQAPITNDVAREVANTAMRTLYVPPPTHFVGLGGHLGARQDTPTFGFSSRVWSRNRVGVQVGFSRSKLAGDLTTDRVRSTEVTPSVIFSMSDYVSESLWLRPYVGGGVALIRSKLYGGVPEVVQSASASTLGYRAFGGVEATLPGAARLAISADAGYQWAETKFDGFDPAGVRFSIAGHWYVK
jgi:hypothetical protein